MKKFKLGTITYDLEADAMYIYLREGKIKETQEWGNSIFVDLNSKNQLIGLEILNVSRKLKILGKNVNMQK